MQQTKLMFQTIGRKFTNITQNINSFIKSTNIDIGLCHLFLQHTSASLVISENADKAVQDDLESFMQKIAPDDTKLYQHNTEGADDMSAHIRSVLTDTSLIIPITNSRLNLGTWQGIFIWEHRYQAHSRNIIVTCWK